MPTTAYHVESASESYDAGWGRVHERLAAADAARRAWLDSQMRRPSTPAPAPACASAAVLTDAEVREIRRRAAGGESYVSIGRDYGMERSAARRAAIGETYGWVR